MLIPAVLIYVMVSTTKYVVRNNIGINCMQDVTQSTELPDFEKGFQLKLLIYLEIP